MELTIYNMSVDVNQFISFVDPRDEYPSKEQYQRLLHGTSFINEWVPPKTLAIEPGRHGNFIGGPCTFADISMTIESKDVMLPQLSNACELLPFRQAITDYLAIYIATPTDCLDDAASEFWGPEKNVDAIRTHVFLESRLPTSTHIFRLPYGFKYYVTQRFVDFICESGLSGLCFRQVWRNDGVPLDEEVTIPKANAFVANTASNRRRSKRDLVLARLWDMIDRHGSHQYINESIESMLGERQDVLKARGEALRRAIDSGISKTDLARLCRSIAYSACFEALVAISEEGLDKGVALKSLYEDLLMADSQK